MLLFKAGLRGCKFCGDRFKAMEQMNRVNIGISIAFNILSFHLSEMCDLGIVGVLVCFIQLFYS